jgi:DNA-directed RNA polymerase II subunit RPB2
VHVCERSGLIAVANLKKQHYSSQIYGADSQVVQVRWLIVVSWLAQRGVLLLGGGDAGPRCLVQFQY